VEPDNRDLLEQLPQVKEVDGSLARLETMTRTTLILVTVLAALTLALLGYVIGLSSEILITPPLSLRPIP
jgi:hypothetical protein